MFVEAAFTKFKKMYELCDCHASREYHKDAVAACDAFVGMMSGRCESVAVLLNQEFRDTIQKNRQMLLSVVETIILCGRQNIALRGHRDSGTDLEVQSAQSNHGNFWALLNFRISADDTHLRDHVQRAARNATCTSPDTQNQLVNILGDHVRDTILGKVRSSLCYTVITDEVTDSSNKEQLSLVLRYVEPETSIIREDLVTFLECDSGTTSEVLADLILSFAANHFDPSKMRGQAYDGASNMSGKTNGTAARISSLYPLALYTHCASHSLT